MNVLIGLDVGTSAVKGILVTETGTVLAHARTATRIFSPSPGLHELDAEEHYRTLCKVLRELASAIPAGARLAGLSMAAASGNTLLLDERNEPLTSIVSWMDGRAAGQREETLPGFDYDGVLEISGWHWTDSFPLAILAWYRAREPELFSRAARFCMNSDYLYWRLTGEWGMDPSTATTFYLADQAGRKWHQPYLDALGIGKENISALKPSATLLGLITGQAAAETGLPAGTPAVLGAFDHPSAARGTGTLTPGDLLLSCGTSWVGFYVLESREKAVEARFLIDPFLSPEGPWAGMFSIPYIGQTVEWYAEHAVLCPEEPKAKLWPIFDGVAAESPLGSNGLCIAPFYDLQARRPRDRIEFDSTTVRSAIARSVMEGVAYELDARIRRYAALGIAASRITMVGGPSESPIWPSLVSDITGLTITLPDNGRHAGALGAAIMAGIGTGLYRDEVEGWKAFSGRARAIEPDPRRHERYREFSRSYQVHASAFN